MSTLTELLTREIARSYRVYVFQAWGDEERVFAQDVRGVRYLGVSAGLWQQMVNTHALETGVDLHYGSKRIAITWMPPGADECEVAFQEPPLGSVARGANYAPPDALLQISSITIRRPVPEPSLFPDPAFRR